MARMKQFSKHSLVPTQRTVGLTGEPGRARAGMNSQTPETLGR